MKTRLFFLTILLAYPYIFSQDEIGIPKLKPVDDYWSIGYYASGNLGLIDYHSNRTSMQPGWGGNIEASYHNKNIELLFIVEESRLNSKSEEEFFHFFEFTLGPRFYLSNKSKIFTEITVGGFLSNRNVQYERYPYYGYSYYSFSPLFGMGGVASVGEKITLGGTSDLIIKLRLHSYLTPGEDFSMFCSLNSGIAFTSVHSKVTGQNQNIISYHKITFYNGVNNPDFWHNMKYNWNYNYGIEYAYRTYKKTEISVGLSHNKIKEKYPESIPGYITSLDASLRFFLNDKKTTAFIEIGGGIYLYNKKYSIMYNKNDLYGGMILGTGALINSSELINFLLKAKMNFLFTEGTETAPSFLALQGGLRFNL